MNLLFDLKPTQVKNEVKAEFSHRSGSINVVSARYKTRVMPTVGQQVDHWLIPLKLPVLMLYIRLST